MQNDQNGRSRQSGVFCGVFFFCVLSCCVRVKKKILSLLLKKQYCTFAWWFVQILFLTKKRAVEIERSPRFFFLDDF